MFIGPKDYLPSRERRDQHEQCGLRQVKVRQHGTDNAELESWIDEDVGLATLRRDAAIFILSHNLGAPPFDELRAGSKPVLLGWVSSLGKFERPDRRRSHRNHSPIGIACSLN